MVLPKSTCKACATITQRFEQACLRAMLGPLRMRIGFPTRRPKQRPSELTFHIRDKAGAIKPVNIPTSQYPRAFFLPMFPPKPEILSGLPHRETWETRLWYYINDETRPLVEQLGGTGFAIGPTKVQAFAQLIAKVAHSYAYAVGGFTCFQPLLVDLILGRQKGVTYVTGTDLDIPPANTHNRYELTLRTYRNEYGQYLIANVRLLGLLGTPLYYAVVGKVPECA
jgi:hypothetical protein